MGDTMLEASVERDARFRHMVYFDKSLESTTHNKTGCGQSLVKGNPSESWARKATDPVPGTSRREEPGSAMAGLPKGRAYPFLAAAREGRFF